MSLQSLTNSSLRRRLEGQLFILEPRPCPGCSGAGLLPSRVRLLLWEDLWLGLASQTSRRAWSQRWGVENKFMTLWICENARIYERGAQLQANSDGGNRQGWQPEASLLPCGLSPLFLPTQVPFSKEWDMKNILKAGLPSEARGTFKHRVWSRFGPRLHKSTSGIRTDLVSTS